MDDAASAPTDLAGPPVTSEGDVHLHRVDDAGRYELFFGDTLVAYAVFQPAGERTVVVPHTEVDPARRGHGIGAVLVGAVLDDLRARGEQVVPRCWYVAQFIDENPDYLDLIARA